MQEIDIDDPDFDMSKIDIWTNNKISFTIDKIEFYLSDEEYELPAIYTVTTNPDPDKFHEWASSTPYTFQKILPITTGALLKWDYILTGVTITDVNGVTYNINDCIITSVYEDIYNYAYFSVEIMSMPDLPSKEITLNFVTENRIP